MKCFLNLDVNDERILAGDIELLNRKLMDSFVNSLTFNQYRQFKLERNRHFKLHGCGWLHRININKISNSTNIKARFESWKAVNYVMNRYETIND